MSGIEEAAALAAIAPEMMAIPEAASIPLAAQASAALAPEMMASFLPEAASQIPLASGAEYLSGASQAAPNGFLAWLGQNAPGATTAMQNTGILGNVVDATGGLETATNAANNVGGGILGKLGAAGTKAISPQAIALQGLKMAGQSMIQPRQAPQGSMPSMAHGDYQPLTAVNQSDEYRKKRDALLRQMLGMK